MAVGLLFVINASASAQRRQLVQDDYLLRVFKRADARHRSARRNLEAILRDQPEFWRELHAVAARIGIEPAWLLNVIACESLFDPDARNPLPGQTASGLLQFIERTARRLGTTTGEVRRMSPVEQLRPIEMYLEPFKGRLKSLSDLYMAVFRGRIIEGGDEVVVVDSLKEPRIYALNKPLDLNGDNLITKGELSLAALSVGRFAPARLLQQGNGNNSYGRVALARGSGKRPQAAVKSPDSASHVISVRQSRPPLSTRSIYVRREKRSAAAGERRY